MVVCCCCGVLCSVVRVVLSIRGWKCELICPQLPASTGLRWAAPPPSPAARRRRNYLPPPPPPGTAPARTAGNSSIHRIIYIWPVSAYRTAVTEGALNSESCSYCYTHSIHDTCTPCSPPAACLSPASQWGCTESTPPLVQLEDCLEGCPSFQQ